MEFSKKRKSEGYTESILFDSPDQLLENKGQIDLFLINAMEDALQEGYSTEYQELIKLYFYNLNEEIND